MRTSINLNPAKVTRVQKAVAYLRREPAYRSLAALLATMRIVPDSRIPTAATDAVSLITVNPEWLEPFETEKAAGVLVHETLHKFNMIHVRFEAWVLRYSTLPRNELARYFNIAQDYLINYSILHDWGLPLPEEGLYNAAYNMLMYTTESLADKLLQESRKSGQGGQPGQQGGQPGQQGESGGEEGDGTGEGDGAGDADADAGDESAGKGKPSASHIRGSGGLAAGDDVMDAPTESGDLGKPLTEQEQADMRARIQRDIASAVRSAKGIGVDAGDFFHQQMAETLKAPTASLAKELNRLASELCRTGHRSWTVPNRKRFLPNGFPMPGPKDVQLGTIIAAVDTSGSTMGETVAYFLNTLVKTVQNVNFKELIVLHCDSRVRKVQRYTKQQAQPGKIDTNTYGGGGTNFKPVFQWIRDNVRGKVSALVYLTDGGVYQSEVPECKRIWERKRFPLLWALYSDWPCVETFVNWVTVNDRFGRVSRLPADKG